MPSLSSASAQGARNHQEDRLVTAEIAGGRLLAVFDGHGGTAAAEKAAHSLPSLFEAALKNQHGDELEALRETMRALVELTRRDKAGSTATIVYILGHQRRAYIAVLGDSPVAVIDHEGRLWIGPDHNARTNSVERLAAESRGAVYIGGYLEDADHPGTGLQMARSLGDAALDRILSREAEVDSVALGDQSLVVLGTDGLLTPLAAPLADQMQRLVNMVRQGADAQALVNDALRRETGDNVTAILWTV